MKFLSKVNVKDKVVLLRADLNSNVINGKVINGERIKQASETIKLLKKKGAKIVVIAHQGRPNRNDCFSLRSHSKFLSKYTKVKFVDDLFGEKAAKVIKNLNKGEAILLENLRMYKEEYKLGKNKMVKKLVGLCDVYVNDAFSNSHRKHASMISFPKYMNSYAGPLVEAELKALKKVRIKRALYVLGGAKPKDDLKLLGRNKVLACGLFGQCCVIAKGKDLGVQNKYLRKTIKSYRKVIRKLKKNQFKVITPIDFAVKVKGKRKDLDLDNFPSKYEIFDIGPKTKKLFIKEIKNAKVVYMKGPVGDFSSKGFAKGTFEILKAISQNKGFSLIGGGHLFDAVNKSQINKNKFGHVSLSGGALARYFAGEKLPGIEALR